jgi:vanillate/3-O-methylgallate O-demethylase
MASMPTLQQGIDQAGSAVKLLWKPGLPPWKPPVVEDEYAGWRLEQRAWLEGVAISDLSHHMRDLFIAGPDSTRLLAETSANDYESFAVGQAKQFVPVTKNGDIIQDGILMRDAEDRYTLSGPPASQNWVLYHGQTGDYDVEFVDDPDSQWRFGGGPPVLFRFQVQGPLALALVEKVFGGPLPEARFFHSVPATLDGRQFRALRHAMSGQAGYEFIGRYEDGDFVKEAFLREGEEFGIVHVGALAYSLNSLESGWIPTPTPGIYTDPEYLAYREWLPLYSLEGQNPLHGSWFSERIEDYYISPYELGYGRSISYNHDFIGRDALETRKDDVPRTKVTIVPDRDDAHEAFPDGFFLTHGRYRLEVDGEPVGMTFHTGPIDTIGEILSLALIDNEHAAPGTAVTFVYGEHPGPGSDPAAAGEYARLRATVQPSPYNEYARTQYRRDD